MALVESGVVQQRLQAVLEVINAGATVRATTHLAATSSMVTGRTPARTELRSRSSLTRPGKRTAVVNRQWWKYTTPETRPSHAQEPRGERLSRLRPTLAGIGRPWIPNRGGRLMEAHPTKGRGQAKGGAMTSSVTRNIEIHAPVEEVFRFVSDPHRRTQAMSRAQTPRRRQQRGDLARRCRHRMGVDHAVRPAHRLLRQGDAIGVCRQQAHRRQVPDRNQGRRSASSWSPRPAGSDRGRRIQQDLARLTRSGDAAGGWAQVMTALMPAPLRGPVYPVARVLFRSMAPEDPTDMLVTLDAEDAFDVGEQLDRVSAPTLVIGGAKDVVYTRELWQRGRLIREPG